MRALLILILSSIVSITGNSQMILSGVATGSCDCYELTDFTNQTGSVWSPGTIDLTNSFDMSFEVNLGVDDVWGADGMVFALRQSGTSPGGIGNGMGYSGITNSIGVEIDTWNSSPAVPSDVVSDHVGMSSNGAVDHGLVAPQTIANIEDGLYHTFRATWDPVALDFEVFLDGTSIFVYTGDLVALYFGGVPDVYFGWTGGTGGVDNVQSVCMYRDADFSSDVITACVGQTVTFTDESTSDLIYNSEEAVTWDWDFGDGSSSTVQNPTHSYTANGDYTVSLTATNSYGNDVMTIANMIHVEMPIAPTTVDASVCDSGSMTLSASGPGILNWYDSPTSGTLINTGGSYITPVLTTPTIYFVESEILQTSANGAKPDNSGGGANFTNDQHLKFDVYEDFEIVSVLVYANGAGNRTVELRNNTGAVINSATINIPDGTSRIDLNFMVSPGVDYQLGVDATGTIDLFRNNGSVAYPYDLAGMGSVTRSSAGTAGGLNHYYFFH